MDNKVVLREFIERVRWLNEVEYGDFRRKLGLYINRLDEELKGARPEFKKALETLRLKIVYDPEPDIEKARSLAVETAEQLLQKLH